MVATASLKRLTIKLNVMDVKSVFAPKGLLAKHFENYEQRPQQVRMAELVASAIKLGRPAVIEGTSGSGKSFSYLIPLILSGKKAVISTSNKSLQDQLSNKDLPALKEVLSMKFDWVVLKGKNNYFCSESFKVYMKDLLKLLPKKEVKRIADWANGVEDGDVEHFPGDLVPQVKELITCGRNTVHERGSPFYYSCFAVRARQRAMEAQIVLVNHTLLALDIALRRKTDGKTRLLPKTEVVIIDEAHIFERYATMAFSDEVNIFSLRHLINRNEIRKSARRGELEALSKGFSAALRRFLPEKGEVYYKQRKVAKFGGFKPSIKRLEGILEKVDANQGLRMTDEGTKRVKEAFKEGNHLIERLLTLSTKDKDMLRWSEARELRGGVSVSLKSVPIDISKSLREGLFKGRTIICTSATLAVNGSFDFFKYQMGVSEKALELIVGSPFDYKRNALVYVSAGEQEKHWEIEQLIKFSKGNAFVLFTSYHDMYEAYQMVNTGYPKLIQAKGISRAHLLEEFKKTPHAVLFATRSFWEGVDVVGDNLVLVVIHKLPFENPSDLLYSSKIEKIDEKLGKGKHWMKYTIPDVCLKLKQGGGRLIRGKKDFGTIALLDARVNFRNYGKMVVNSLPPAPRTQKLEDVKEFYKEKLTKRN